MEIDRRSSVELPDAIESIGEIQEILGANPILFLDFDGTLAPIVAHYDDAGIETSVRAILSDLGDRYTVGIISGRAAADVKRRVGVPGMIYSGSHGQEIVYPDGNRYEHPDSLRARDQVDEAEQALRARLVSMEGVNLERKPFGLVVHTREAVVEGDRLKATAVTKVLAESFPDLVIRTGKEVIELRPDNEWNKGSAIEFLCRSFGQPTPLFIGDDETDEDGFAVVNQLAGVSVLVAPHPGRQTFARFKLDDTNSVAEFLHFL